MTFHNAIFASQYFHAFNFLWDIICREWREPHPIHRRAVQLRERDDGLRAGDNRLELANGISASFIIYSAVFGKSGE